MKRAKITNIGLIAADTATTTTAVALDAGAGTDGRLGVWIHNTGGTNALLVRLRTDTTADITAATATFTVGAGVCTFVEVSNEVAIDVEAAASTTTYVVTEAL